MVLAQNGLPDAWLVVARNLGSDSLHRWLDNRFDGYAPRPDYRPLTKFENRGLQLGHGVWDLVFERR